MLSRIIRTVGNRVPAHAGDRLQEAVLPRRPFEELKLPKRSALTVICDDGETSDLEIVRTLDKHGVKGVFAISPDLVGRPGFLGYADLRAMHSAGHEIAFHGTTHDGFTRYRGPSVLDASLRAGLAELQSQGLSGSRTLVYPYGLNNRWVRGVASSLFEVAFTTWYGLNVTSANRYAVRRVPFGAYTGKRPSTEAWYRRMIDEALHRTSWPALMLHPAAAGHTSEHTQMLDRLIGYAIANGLPVSSAGDHLRFDRPNSDSPVVARVTP